MGTSYVSELFFIDLYHRYFSPKILHALFGYFGTELQEVKKIRIINKLSFYLKSSFARNNAFSI